MSVGTQRPRVLHSLATPLYKFVGGPLWIVLAVGATGFAMVGASEVGLEDPSVIGFVLVILFLWVGVLWHLIGSMAIKTVVAQPDGLEVGNYFASERIPYSNVEDVFEIVLSNPRIVVLTLREPSRFGGRITYRAKWFWVRWRLFDFQRDMDMMNASHEDTDWLRYQIAEARNRSLSRRR